MTATTTRTTRPTPLTFDPVTIGRLECDAWAAYYRREWLTFLRAAVGMVHAGFGMNRRRTLLGAWYVLRANQVWAPYPDNDPPAAREQMRRFYALVARHARPGFDPATAAALEVEWWRVHRRHQHAADLTQDDLTSAVSALYGYVYGVSAEAVRPAAALRMRAMQVSDRWVGAGCDRNDPLLARERRLLVASYSALREALDRA